MRSWRCEWPYCSGHFAIHTGITVLKSREEHSCPVLCGFSGGSVAQCGWSAGWPQGARETRMDRERPWRPGQGISTLSSGQWDRHRLTGVIHGHSEAQGEGGQIALSRSHWVCTGKVPVGPGVGPKGTVAQKDSSPQVQLRFCPHWAPSLI